MWKTVFDPVFEDNDQKARAFLRSLATPTDENLSALDMTLRDMFQSTRRATQTLQRRIQFALYISNILWTGTYDRENMSCVDHEETRTRMEMLQELSDNQRQELILSKSILEPFKKRCESLRTLQNQGREPQEGDDRLQELVDNLDSITK